VALTFQLQHLVGATLPAGMGWVGMVGMDPAGGAYHAWAPVPLATAQALGPLGQADPALFGGRPGWRYRLCPTYLPPAPGRLGSDLAAIRAARLMRARLTGLELVAWARGLGVWAELAGGDACH